MKGPRRRDVAINTKQPFLGRPETHHCRRKPKKVSDCTTLRSVELHVALRRPFGKARIHRLFVL